MVKNPRQTGEVVRNHAARHDRTSREPGDTLIIFGPTESPNSDPAPRDATTARNGYGALQPDRRSVVFRSVTPAPRTPRRREDCPGPPPSHHASWSAGHGLAVLRLATVAGCGRLVTGGSFLVGRSPCSGGRCDGVAACCGGCPSTPVSAWSCEAVGQSGVGVPT